MATSSFYNDNLYRTYPFTADSRSVIPNELLAGMKVYFICGAGFSSFPSVFLTDWNCVSGRSVLTLSCESDGKTVVKTIEIPPATLPFTRIVSDDSSGIRIVLVAGRTNQPDVHKGNLRMRLEPVCAVWFQHRGISSVQIGNRPRRVLPMPEGIEDECYGQADWRKQGKEKDRITGPLLFSPGFNCRLISRAGNKLQIDAVQGAGLGEVQEDISKGWWNCSGIMVWEEPPADFLRKDGLPNDENVLYAFCGAVGPHIQVTSSSTVQVTQEPEIHTIVISTGNLGGGVC